VTLGDATVMTARPDADPSEEIPLSAIVEAVLREAERRPVSLGELIDRTADRGFGLIMLMLGLPMLIPFLPPGSSTVVGPIYAAFAVQMVKGSQRPWVPQRLREWVLPWSTVRALRRRGIPLIRAAERFSRPRTVWLEDRVAVRLVGIMVFLMGIILLSPLPLLNTLPALSVMLIGMGMLNRDVAFMAAGVVVGGLSLGLIGLSAGLIVVLIQRLRSFMF
jgi:hypothetical protein